MKSRAYITSFDFSFDEKALLSSLYSGDAKGLVENRAAIEDTDAIAQVARIGNETVAWAMAILNYREDYGLPPDSAACTFLNNNSSYLIHIEVRQDLWRQGIGSALLKAVEKGVKAQGKKLIYLHTPETRSKAYKFYESNGWIHENTIHLSNRIRRVYCKNLHRNSANPPFDKR